MNVRSTIGNIMHNVQNNLASSLIASKIQNENIVGSTITSLSNLWSGGFTGMSESGIAELRTQLANYCEEVQAIIEGFDQTGDITAALKGDVQTAAYDFIAAIKTLLQAYVSTMKQEIQEVDEAYQNFIISGQSIAQDVNEAASDIRSNANSISLD